MPEKILKLLEQDSMTEQQIAEKLAISREEVKACMEYLLHTGFIRSETIIPTKSSCSGNCNKCKGSCNSQSGSSYTVWEICS